MNKIEKAGAVVKWAGGKSKLAPTIEEAMNKRFDINELDVYVEPFVGGGSFFFYITQKYKFKRKIISDVNLELINLYQVIQKKPKELIIQAETLQKEYNSLENLDQKSNYFYSVRALYNNSIRDEQSSLNIEQAANFLFLNKVGFNGLYRVNSKGLYNVPFGKRETANLYNEDNIFLVSELLQDTTILHCDYQDTLRFASNQTLYYFDPPYRPLSTSSSFTSYAKSSFNDDSQRELAKFCQKIHLLNTKFALSNSDPKNQNEEDHFFDDLYKSFYIHRIFATRMIGAKSTSRGKVSEILVTN